MWTHHCIYVYRDFLCKAQEKWDHLNKTPRPVGVFFLDGSISWDFLKGQRAKRNFGFWTVKGNHFRGSWFISKELSHLCVILACFVYSISVISSYHVSLMKNKPPHVLVNKLFWQIQIKHWVSYSRQPDIKLQDWTNPKTQIVNAPRNVPLTF